MKNKKEIFKFLIWTRNGTAFCTTWLLILWLSFCCFFGQQTITVTNLVKMILLVFGGAAFFSLCFTKAFIKQWHFTTRLTVFMFFISFYECLAFYWIGLFRGTGSLLQWSILIGIVLLLYLLCIAIYQYYSKRKGILYTNALQNYQLQRRNDNEK